MQGVARRCGPQDAQIAFEKGHAGTLHGRLHQQPLANTKHHRAGHWPCADPGLRADVFEVGEHLLDHAGDTDELRDVRFGDGASEGAKPLADPDVVPIQTHSHHWGLIPAGIDRVACVVWCHGVALMVPCATSACSCEASRPSSVPRTSRVCCPSTGGAWVWRRGV